MSKSNGVVIYCILLMICSSSSSFAHTSQVSSERPDPLRHFKPYNGTYDIRDDHYWASAAFTSVHGYVMAGVWLLFGLVFGSYMIIKNVKSDDPPVLDYPNSSYFVMFGLIVLFTVLAIVATSVVMAANRKFLLRARKLKGTIDEAGLEAYQSIRRVIDVMVQMHAYLQPYDATTCQMLNSTSHQLRRESKTIQHFVEHTRHSSGQAIETLYLGNLVISILNLVLLIAALEDTCSALEEFEQYPQNNSLQNIVPCSNSSQSNKILVHIASSVHNFIGQINMKITKSSEVLGFEEGKNNVVGVHEICDPFSGAPDYSYKPAECPKGAIPISDLPNALARFTCYQQNSTADCLGSGRFLPESSYAMALAYSLSIGDLLIVFPDLLNLTRCSAVKEAFYDILHHQCKPFRSITHILWASMLCHSIVMVVLVSLWMAKAYQDRERTFLTFSIIPESTQGNQLRPTHSAL